MEQADQKKNLQFDCNTCSCSHQKSAYSSKKCNVSKHETLMSASDCQSKSSNKIHQEICDNMHHLVGILNANLGLEQGLHQTESLRAPACQDLQCQNIHCKKASLHQASEITQEQDLSSHNQKEETINLLQTIINKKIATS